MELKKDSFKQYIVSILKDNIVIIQIVKKVVNVSI